MPLLSIIVPVYKVEACLDRCVASILAQTFSDFELILVDDGSPDRCPQMCDAWAKKDARIRVIHKPNGGLSAARNCGFDAARGDFIGFVDSDDWIAPDMYEHLYEILIRSGADFSSVEMMIASDETQEPPRKDSRIRILDQRGMYDRFFRKTDFKIHYFAWDKLYRRQLLEQVRFWEGMLFEDIYFNFQIIAHASRAACSNQVKYFWFFNSGSITRQGVVKRDMEAIQIWRQIAEDSRIICPEYEHDARMNFERAHMGILGKSIKFGVSDSYAEWEADRQYLLAKTRRFYFDLIRWKMPVSRKVLLTLLCICPGVVFGIRHLCRGDLPKNRGKRKKEACRDE